MANTIDFIIDDEAAARQFVKSLGERIVSLRFSDYANWAPDHTVLATINGKAVALADAIVTVPGEAAEFGLIARPRCGAYAIRALLQLKKQVPMRYWSTSLNKPTPATVAISRRFATVTFDHFSLQIAGAIVERCGERPEAEPMVLFPSTECLRSRHLPPLSRWNDATKSQVLFAAQNVSQYVLRDPNGGAFGQDLFGFAADILDISMKARQTFSRLTMLAKAEMFGLPVDPKRFGPILPPNRLNEILGALMSARVGPMTGGILDLSSA